MSTLGDVQDRARPRPEVSPTRLDQVHPDSPIGRERDALVAVDERLQGPTMGPEQDRLAELVGASQRTIERAERVGVECDDDLLVAELIARVRLERVLPRLRQMEQLFQAARDNHWRARQELERKWAAYLNVQAQLLPAFRRALAEERIEVQQYGAARGWSWAKYDELVRSVEAVVGPLAWYQAVAQSERPISRDSERIAPSRSNPAGS